MPEQHRELNSDISSGRASTPPAEYTFRAATAADIPAIREVLFKVRHEFGVGGSSHVGDADLDDLDGNYFRRGGFFEVVESADRGAGEDARKRILGCVGLYPVNRDRAELCKMYLEKSARGCGIGRRLLEDALDAARRNGFAEVWLKTHSSLTDAIRLYQHYGFQPVPVDCLLPRCDVAYLLRLR